VIDRAAVQRAAARGALLGVAFAITEPTLFRLQMGEWWEVPRSATFGLIWGAMAAPCALLEGAGRRRGGAGITAATLAVWTLATAIHVLWPAAYEYASQAGGEAGLHAAAKNVSWAGVALWLPWALGASALYAAVTLSRAAGAGLLGQVTFVYAAMTSGLALSTWASDVNRLSFTYDAMLKDALVNAAPYSLLAVLAAALVDRVAWRSAAVPARITEGALPWTGMALALVLLPLGALHRSPEGARTSRHALAERMVRDGARNRWFAAEKLIEEAPVAARAVLLDIALRGDAEVVRHPRAFEGHAGELEALLDHADPAVRCVGLRALEQVADASSVDAVAARLEDAELAVRDLALGVLVNPTPTGYRAAQRLEKFRTAVDASVVVHARARALLAESATRAQALELLERTWAVADASQREEARRALDAAAVTESDSTLRARLQALR
jgi:hypothetical protein